MIVTKALKIFAVGRTAKKLAKKGAKAKMKSAVHAASVCGFICGSVCTGASVYAYSSIKANIAELKKGAAK